MKSTTIANLLRAGLYLAAAALLIAVAYGCSTATETQSPEIMTQFYEVSDSVVVAAWYYY